MSCTSTSSCMHYLRCCTAPSELWRHHACTVAHVTSIDAC